MALQLSVAVRNARLNAIPTTIGASPVMEIFTGAPPADCADADSGTLLATLDLPATWLAAAANGSAALEGTWQANASAAGTAGHFRIYDNGLDTCHAQGTITESGGGGDMIVDNTSFAAGQQFTVTSFTLTDGNA